MEYFSAMLCTSNHGVIRMKYVLYSVVHSLFEYLIIVC